MRKILVSLLASASITVFADNSLSTSPYGVKYAPFQQFDDQYNIGFGFTSGNLTNGSSGGTNNSQFINLEIERLFDIGIWMDINANLVTYYSEKADPAFAGVYPSQTTGSQPNFGGVNAAVGYAFPLVSKHLMITPYVTGGRNTNLSTTVMFNAGTANSGNNMTGDYFWTVGGGARLEYRVNSVFDFYLDQNLVYNASQAPGSTTSNPNDNYMATSTIGAKFNIWRNFQLGAKAFYNNYYFTQAQTAIAGNALVPENSVGGLVTVGLTY